MDKIERYRQFIKQILTEHAQMSSVKGNREQGTGNSVGFGRGFDPVQNKAAYRGGGL